MKCPLCKHDSAEHPSHDDGCQHREDGVICGCSGPDEWWEYSLG